MAIPFTRIPPQSAVILSVALTPLFVMLHVRYGPKPDTSAKGMARPQDEGAHVELLGFGRLGQIVNQTLTARGWSITTIDTEPDLINLAAPFGFKVFCGDGTRLDILQAAGAATARALIVDVNDPAAATRFTALLHRKCPLVPVLVRALDRPHAMKLVRAGATYEMRETFETVLALWAQALQSPGEVRRRDSEHPARQKAGNDRLSGGDLMLVFPGPRLNIPTQHPGQTQSRFPDGKRTEIHVDFGTGKHVFSAFGASSPPLQLDRL